MSSQLDLNTLVNKLQSHPSTAGWDAVCSYQADRLNSILADQFNNLPQISTIKLGDDANPYQSIYSTFHVSDEVKGIKITLASYTFALSAPTLQFSGANSDATLVMPIQSANQSGLAYTFLFAINIDQHTLDSLKPNTWYFQDASSKAFTEKNQQDVLGACWDAAAGKAKSPFPTNVYYRASSDNLGGDYNNKLYTLQSVDSAYTGAANSEDGPNPFAGTAYQLKANVPIASMAGNQVHPSGTVVTFDIGNGRTEGQIILNFDISNGSGATFALIDGAGNNATPNLLKTAPKLLTDLTAYFSTAMSGVQLCLAEVSAKAVSSEQISVRPRSFIFSSSVIDGYSVLSIYMNIDGSSTANPSGQPTFQYADGTAGIPIPSGYTGSLILSRDYLTNVYFLKAFQRAGFNILSPTGNTNSPISFTGRLHRPTTVQGKNIDVAISFASVISGFTGADFGTVHVDDYAFGFEFRDASTFLVKSSNVATVNVPVYLHYQVIVPGSFFPPPPITDTKQAKEQLHISKSISLADAQPRSDGFNLEFSINRGDYSVTSSSNIRGICDDHAQRDVENKVRQEIGDIAPSIKVTLPELQTLALENLLFNGQARFQLIPDAKMHFPHDLLLLGQLQ